MRLPPGAACANRGAMNSKRNANSTTTDIAAPYPVWPSVKKRRKMV